MTTTKQNQRGVVGAHVATTSHVEAELTSALADFSDEARRRAFSQPARMSELLE